MDRLKALAIFKSVVDQGGFARAAASMNLSASLVTRSVQELEALLGVRLLQRTTRSVALTSVGESVFERASDLLASYDELEAFSSLSAREPHGLIRLAAPSAYGRCYLGQALAKFRDRWPKVAVDLRLHDDASDGAADDAELELCLGHALRPSRVARELARIDVALHASVEFLQRHGEPASPRDLERFDGLIGRGHRAAGWSLVREATGERHVVHPRAVLHSTHDEVLLEAAVHGAGIVQLPTFIVDASPSAGRLRRVLPGWRADPVSVHLTYESRRNQSQAVRKLIEHLVEWFAGGNAAASTNTLPPRPARHVQAGAAVAA